MKYLVSVPVQKFNYVQSQSINTNLQLYNVNRNIKLYKGSKRQPSWMFK